MRWWELSAVLLASALLATFCYEPTLTVYFGWADHIMGVAR